MDKTCQPMPQKRRFNSYTGVIGYADSEWNIINKIRGTNNLFKYSNAARVLVTVIRNGPSYLFMKLMVDINRIIAGATSLRQGVHTH